ncbi:uncharacterized protein Pyn_30632 [Prunus yedoensis var. nudiflora]|uniref:Uncharacterized protein n=1 Tax=Prunus yedoensis var. nudiflora TaxID=2094558 RepID=A0A314U5N3_PRUYE|nr:uncharacterized protein Pyn_30632 [Prunus yedoensis var. nudiflora]
MKVVYCFGQPTTKPSLTRFVAAITKVRTARVLARKGSHQSSGILFFLVATSLTQAGICAGNLASHSSLLESLSAPASQLKHLASRISLMDSSLVMASADSSFIIRDHLYSIEDKLKRGRPPPLLKGAGEDTVIDGEPAPEVAPVIDPASISSIRAAPARAGQNG